ncbi:hypothetical protein TSUD_134820 [Trifolium subterraneum]|uniref:Uncharacterized protein n=1 Tax=Trifolium subterraneum TaxID=3900 RepID=A0A2Z6NBK1_TRISU|nr:hypothetical protein TSUD_134820 [Trifolium subterraneum]
MASSSQVSFANSTTNPEIDTKPIYDLLHDLKELLMNKFDAFQEEGIYNCFSQLVDDLGWYSSNLNTAQLGFLSSAKLLSHILQTEIPAYESITKEGIKTCQDLYKMLSQKNSDDESLVEKRNRVATYEHEQLHLAGKIHFHEEELKLLRARDYQLAENIKADKECILSQEGLYLQSLIRLFQDD